MREQPPQVYHVLIFILLSTTAGARRADRALKWTADQDAKLQGSSGRLIELQELSATAMNEVNQPDSAL